jgi:hypothetical protein
MDVLVRIKRLVLQGRIRFTDKAGDEMDAFHLRISDVVESIANAQAISKTIRTTSRSRRYAGEKLYVIKSFNLSGTLIYTKGGIAREGKGEYFYILVAAKIATIGD